MNCKKYIITENEQLVMEYREQGLTQTQIAQKLNLSKGRIAIIEKVAFKKTGLSDYVYNAYKERSLEKVDIKKINESIKYYQAHIKVREEKLERLQKLQAPQNLIKTEVNLLNRDKLNLRCLIFASNAYNQGVHDGKKTI